MDAISTEFVHSLVIKGWSYREISEYLRNMYPQIQRGLSDRSVRRFCSEHSITKLRGIDLNQVVEKATTEVGHTYGRSMMKGYLESKGIKIAEHRVAESLKAVAPDKYEERRYDLMDRFNPIPYRAQYYGHKLHLDQNEKLRMYGVTHVIARDGFSGKIVCHLSMPVKNNLAIYEYIFRPAVNEYGLWSQIRVREFYLILFIQENLRSQCGPRNILPYVQSPSCENMTAERIWPEVNKRVNYPIKAILVDMDENNEIDMSASLTKFCVSFISLNVSTVGMNRFVQSWNCHTISGSGIPNELQNRRYQPIPIAPQCIPSTDEARQKYEQQRGRLTEFGLFGRDPLRNSQEKVHRRDEIFASNSPSFEAIFSNVISGDGSLLKSAILTHINITESLQH